MAVTNKSLLAVNIFGALGYLSNFTQWMWSLLLVAYPLLSSGSLWSLPRVANEPSQTSAFVPTGPFAIIFAAFITIIVIAIAIYSIVAVPRAVGKTGASVTRRVATVALPVVTHHKKITPKERTRVSFSIISALKIASIILPVILIAAFPGIAPIEQSAAVGAAMFFAIVSSLYFLVQYGLAVALKVDRKKIW